MTEDEELLDAERKKNTDSGEGESAQGTVMVDGAVSKGDGDAKMTKKRQNKIMRAASVAVRMMVDKGDSMIKALSGNYNTMESDLRQMSGADLNRYISSNPTHMDKTGTTWVQKEMKQSGYQKQLDVLSLGTLEAAQRAVKTEIADVLRDKSLVELDPDQQSFVWDKLAELGVVSGNYENNIGGLESALSGLASESKTMEAAMKNLSREGISNAAYRPEAPAVKEEFKAAVLAEFKTAAQDKKLTLQPIHVPSATFRRP